MTREEALRRLRALGFDDPSAQTLFAHFDDAERRGKLGHGYARIAWLETQSFDRAARPRKLEATDGLDRWEGAGALGYLTLQAICDDVLAAPPAGARVVVAERCFPTGMLGYWARLLADGAGLVALLTATSPRRLPHPAGGAPLTSTGPVAIAVPSGDGRPLVADVAMSAATWGAVIAGTAREENMVPFGGEQAHKAFALAAGLQLLVDALAGPEHGAVLLVARPDHDPVPAFRALAAGLRLPGDS
jgi:LDH2 family malate/lactate/ureidoglycolate dehydrogenase